MNYTTTKLVRDCLIEQLREEMWEAKDKTTQMVLEKDAKGDYSDGIDFDDFRKKYTLECSQSSSGNRNNRSA